MKNFFYHSKNTYLFKPGFLTQKWYQGVTNSDFSEINKVHLKRINEHNAVVKNGEMHALTHNIHFSKNKKLNWTVDDQEIMGSYEKISDTDLDGKPREQFMQTRGVVAKEEHINASYLVKEGATLDKFEALRPAIESKIVAVRNEGKHPINISRSNTSSIIDNKDNGQPNDAEGRTNNSDLEASNKPSAIDEVNKGVLKNNLRFTKNDKFDKTE
jgi:hypothetical protein